MSLDYTNWLAKRINGEVAQGLLRGGYLQYKESEEWLDERAFISVKTATGAELELLGQIAGAKRPYALINGEVVYADDDTYRKFILCIARLRTSQSIAALSEMLGSIVTNGMYELEIKAENGGDIQVTLDETFIDFLPFLQTAANEVYTALPRLAPFTSRDYHLYFYRHGFYPVYVHLDDPDWDYAVNTTTHFASLTCTDASKFSISDHGLVMTVERS